MIELQYIETLPDNTKEIRTLTIDSRVQNFSEDIEVYNPTEDENAFFYGITVNGQREQIQAFAPGKEGTIPMTKAEADSYVESEIIQIKSNFGIN